MAEFTLQPALDLAERRAEAKSRVVKVAYVAWLNARTRLVRLEQRRKQYTNSINLKMQQPCSALVVRQAGEALQQWQADMASAMRELERARREWQLALEGWQVEKKRMEALLALARRHLLEERKREEKRERRLHDELSARSAFASHYSRQNGIGFLIDEAEHS